MACSTDDKDRKSKADNYYCDSFEKHIEEMSPKEFMKGMARMVFGGAVLAGLMLALVYIIDPYIVKPIKEYVHQKYDGCVQTMVEECKYDLEDALFLCRNDSRIENAISYADFKLEEDKEECAKRLEYTQFPQEARKTAHEECIELRTLQHKMSIDDVCRSAEEQLDATDVEEK